MFIFLYPSKIFLLHEQKPIFLEYLTYCLLGNSKIFYIEKTIANWKNGNHENHHSDRNKTKRTLPFLGKNGKKLTYSSLVYKHLTITNQKMLILSKQNVIKLVVLCFLFCSPNQHAAFYFFY